MSDGAPRWVAIPVILPGKDNTVTTGEAMLRVTTTTTVTVIPITADFMRDAQKRARLEGSAIRGFAESGVRSRIEIQGTEQVLNPILTVAEVVELIDGRATP